MNLKELKTLTEISKKYNIPVETLRYRLKCLEEDKEYRRLGTGQSIILTPWGVEKITGGKNEQQ